MKPIRILYDLQHFERSTLTRNKFKKLSEKINQEIELDIHPLYEETFKQHLKRDPHRDLVIVHMGSKCSNKFIQSFSDFRRFYGGLLIAESSKCGIGEDASEYILNYFDEYIPLSNTDTESIERILKNIELSKSLHTLAQTNNFDFRQT